MSDMQNERSKSNSCMETSLFVKGTPASMQLKLTFFLVFFSFQAMQHDFIMQICLQMKHNNAEKREFKI